jgi:glucosamine--fructose-6-phosphate aminotransferase (isomerizing)
MMVSALEDEIRSQPEILQQRAVLVRQDVADAGRLLGQSDVDYVVIAGRGTSKNAARYAQYVWGSETGMLVSLARPLLFQSKITPRLKGAAVVGISQSGESPDVVSVLRAANLQGRPIIAITNNVDSPLAREADVVVPLLVGPELAVPATKTFLASLQTVIQIAAILNPNMSNLSLIDEIPQRIGETIDAALRQFGTISTLAGVNSLTVLGRGAGYAAACEIALKIREVTGIRAESYSVPEYLHGPIGGTVTNSPIWLIASPDQEDWYWSSLIETLHLRGCEVTALAATSFNPKTSSMLTLPDHLPPWLFAMLASVVGQAASLRIGELAGLNVDYPEGLRKITLTS